MENTTIDAKAVEMEDTTIDAKAVDNPIVVPSPKPTSFSSRKIILFGVVIEQQLPVGGAVLPSVGGTAEGKITVGDERADHHVGKPSIVPSAGGDGGNGVGNQQMAANHPKDADMSVAEKDRTPTNGKKAREGDGRCSDMSLDTGEEPVTTFECPWQICKQICANKEALFDHIRVHTRPNPRNEATPLSPHQPPSGANQFADAAVSAGKADVNPSEKSSYLLPDLNELPPEFYLGWI